MKLTFDLNDAIDNRVFNAPEGYRRLTINLPEGLHKKIKFCAIQNDTTVTDIITDLIEQYFGTTVTFKEIEEQTNKILEEEVKKYTKAPAKRGRPFKLSQSKGKK